MNTDHYNAALSAICFMTLLITLKLSLTGRVGVGASGKTFFIFHPIWFGPLAVMIPLVIGHYLKGRMSPWPVAAYAATYAKDGFWAALLAGISTTTVDLWLFWAAAAALLTFTEPMATIYEPIPKSMHKYFYMVNLIAGAFVIYKTLSAPNV